jgi:hypothetical protein
VIRIWCTAAWISLILALASPPAVAGTCFRGRPGDECQTFWITEFSYARRLNALAVEREVGNGRWLLTGEIGHMVNLGRRNAIGGTISGAFDDRGSRVAIKARGRRWLSKTVAADLGLGVILAGEDNSYEASFPAFTGYVGLMTGDLIGFGVWVDAIPAKPKPEISSEPIGTDVAVYAGIKGGGYVGLVGGIATFIAAAIAVSTIEGP